MDDELDTLTAAQPDLQETSSPVGANQHGEVIESKYPDGVLIGVEHVLIGDTVLACTVEDDRIHVVKLP